LNIASINYKTSQHNYLPTINGNASHGYNFGQTIDPFTNQFATNRVQFNNFYLSSSLTLFAGLANHYTKKINGINQQISAINLQIEKRNIIIDVISSYLQVKLNQEIVRLKVEHLTFSTQQLKKAKLLESLNYETKQKRLQIEAQFSKDNYDLILAENDLKKSLLLLQQVIGRDLDSTFSLNENLNYTSIFSVDEELLNKLEAERNLYLAKQFKGQLSPRLVLNGSLGSGYSENNKFISSTGEFISKPFDIQLGENFYQSISATLTIPVFNSLSPYANIKINQLESEQTEISNIERLKALENQILLYKREISNNEEAVLAANYNLESFALLFEEAQMSFNNNAMDYFSYIQIKDMYYNAQSAHIQANYRLVFSKLIFSIFSNQMSE
jgi:outer membrane protein